MNQSIKSDKEIMRILKVEYIARPLMNTSKGLLSLVVRNTEDEYHLTLDAVPLEKETNDLLLANLKTFNENLQSEQKGDDQRTYEDNTGTPQERSQVGSTTTGTRIEANKKEVK